MAYDPVLAEIGAKIVKRREELHMTAVELATRVVVSANSLSLYETGQRAMGIDKMYRIARALKVSFSYFQPEELTIDTEVQEDCFAALEKLTAMPVEKRTMLMRMFQAQIAVLERLD